MSNLELNIGGKLHQIACAPGDEPHVMHLGRMIDMKLGELGASAEGQSDARQLLMAALMLADELHEVRTLAASGAASGGDPRTDDSGTMPAGFAERLESLASSLEQLALNA